MPADNSTHLRAAAQRRREQTLQRARDALRQLEAAGEPITFDLVARTAQVSRAWLYSEPDIRQAIEQLRTQHRATTSAPIPASQRASDASLLARLQAAHARNRELASEVRQLREQLARAHGQLRAARLLSAPPSSAADSSADSPSGPEPATRGGSRQDQLPAGGVP